LQEASLAIPLFSPVIVPMAQSFGPILSQLTSSPTVRFGVRCVSLFSISKNSMLKGFHALVLFYIHTYIVNCYLDNTGLFRRCTSIISFLGHYGLIHFWLVVNWTIQFYFIPQTSRILNC
jgi:hypothetical protein